MEYEKIFNIYSATLGGRYIHNQHIVPLLPDDAVIAGWSVQDREIYAVTVGTGSQRIMIWSQMHGNESTTTKAVMDFLHFIQSEHPVAQRYCANFTFLIIPILNPDGAFAYTRENANGVDLNRDFLNRSQPESRLLWKLFESFAPDFCFNMHDQRTIYGAGDSGKPATVSFLAPAFNADRDWDAARHASAAIIANMNGVLQAVIPGQIGRYDDTFNINCVGDAFQNQGVPTVLFEAGHFPGDYEREQTRKCIFIALLAGLQSIIEKEPSEEKITDYLNIPQNVVNFYDFVYKNVSINYENIKIFTNFAAQYREVLLNGKISFEAFIVEDHLNAQVFGHREFDAMGGQFSSGSANSPAIGMPANFTLGNVVFTNGLQNE